MKSPINRLSYLLIVVLLLSAACNDNEEGPDRRDLLIGTWEIQSGELDDYRVTVQGVEVTKATIGAVSFIPQVGDIVDAIEDASDILFPPGSTITFNADNSFVLNDQTEVTNGTWSLDDDQEVISVQADNDLGVDQLDFIIKSLTAQTIDVAFQIEDDDVNLEDLGLDELPVSIDDFTIDYSFNFTKQ